MSETNDLWVTAQTVWGEARGESLEGRIAVAHVIQNRVWRLLRQRPSTLEPYVRVCRMPWQFSCWNANNPNRALLEVLSLSNLDFASCLHVAVDVLSGQVPSPVGHARHYFNPVVVAKIPAWAQGKTPVCSIGHHDFYEGIA